MAEETIGIDLDLSASGDAANQLRQTASETTRLAEAQERHNRALAEAERLQRQGLGRVAGGNSPTNTAAPTRTSLPYDEQMRLRDQFGSEAERQSRARAERMSEAERAHLHQQARYGGPLQAGLGAGTGAQQAQHVEAEREYERLLERTRSQLEKQNKARKQRNRLEEDLRKSGHLAPEFSPEQQRTLRAQRGIAAEQESRLQQRENLTQRYGQVGGLVHDYKTGSGVAGVVAGSLAALGTTLQTVASASNIYQSSLLTGAQASRQFAESIPIIGRLASAWHNFTDMVSGTLARLAEQAVRYEYRAGTTSAMLSAQSQATPIERQIEGAQARYESRRFAPGRATMFSAAPGNVFDPYALSAWSGRLPLERQIFDQRAHLSQIDLQARAERQRETGLRGRIAELQRESQTAQRGLVGAQNAEDQRTHGRDHFREGRWVRGTAAAAWDAGAEFFSPTRRKAEIDDHAQRRAALEKELHGQQALLQQSLARQGELAVERAQKESELRKTLVELDRQRLGILRQQETVIRQQQTTFAGLTRGQQSLALRFARQGRENFASLNPYQRRALVEAGAGDFVQRGLEQMGERDPRNREFRELTSPFGGKSLGETLREKVALEQKIQVDIVHDDDKLARTLELALEKFGTAQIRIVNEAVNALVNQLVAGQIQRQNVAK